MITQLPARFWAKTKEEDRGYKTPCLTWTAFIMPNGYGRFHWQGKVQYAHRVAYEAQFGPIPAEVDGQMAVIDHKCRNRACVKADHMEVVTNRENILRGRTTPAANARKTHCSKGHEFTAENTGRTKSGTRTCLTCVSEHRQERNEARRAASAAKPPRQPRTHCRNGHEYTTENTYVNPAGARECRTCRRAGQRPAPAKRTHCPSGHPYDEANTRIKPDGSRVCRACNRERSREAKRAERARKHASQ